MTGKKCRVVYLLFSVITLLIGFVTYYLFRELSDLIFFRIFGIHIANETILLPANIFSNFIKYNLCDGLWILSGILLLRFIWFNNHKVCQYYVIIFLCIGLLLEFLQIIESIPGTFDVFDILTMVSFALLEHSIYFYMIRRRTQWVKNV